MARAGLLFVVLGRLVSADGCFERWQRPGSRSTRCSLKGGCRSHPKGQASTLPLGGHPPRPPPRLPVSSLGVLPNCGSSSARHSVTRRRSLRSEAARNTWHGHGEGGACLTALARVHACKHWCRLDRHEHWRAPATLTGSLLGFRQRRRRTAAHLQHLGLAQPAQLAAQAVTQLRQHRGIAEEVRQPQDLHLLGHLQKAAGAARRAELLASPAPPPPAPQRTMRCQSLQKQAQSLPTRSVGSRRLSLLNARGLLQRPRSTHLVTLRQRPRVDGIQVARQADPRQGGALDGIQADQLRA